MDSCRKITQLVSEGLDRELSLGERLRIRFHLALCRGCNNFERQMKAIRGFSRALLDRIASDKDA